MDVSAAYDAGPWEALNASSSQGSAFCATSFVRSLGYAPEYWFVEDRGRKILGAIVLLDDGDPVEQPAAFAMYQGILVHPEIERLPSHSRIPLLHEAVTALLDRLTKKYNKVSFSLHPSFRDARPFQWFDFENERSPKFTLKLKYTAILTFSNGIQSYHPWLDSIRDLRLRDHRKAVKKCFQIAPLRDIGVLEELYVSTFRRQGLEVPLWQRTRIRRIAERALENDRGWLLQANRAGEPPSSAALFLKHESTAYYLIGANHPDGREYGVGTFLMIEAIRLMIDSGIVCVDMCGANSPRRGDYKTSLNAELVPYHEVAWSGQPAYVPPPDSAPVT